ncbi:CYTH domain-containing protein [Algibacter amylolyticus]|uniref:CYTH domain-containing protein n=1 Tax=Algibacter amylolyticus TaxID=1608400 RepID=A0A5M7BIR8_9FLAO|nr:CYTH domain-containing protein [Algibacter amylolyticus]KAA5827554.1 CYTH domain-containing protein [Algibacter amylolyticus]MBB5266760.1 CYTH domain-containing protein [Algibacter amylolyticus]TSJ81799.1 CYTH domain-containing protein [Algibacter amylolyticus]
MIEIERKFLVTSNAFKTEAFKSTRITQGYLNSNKDRAVRVRIKGEQGFLTIKGASSKNGLSRFEWEKEIPRKEAQELLNLCEPGVIDKTRYEVKVGRHIFEIDTFYGGNEGLIIAEIELKNENETFEKPNWLGEEVSGQIKYYNSQLSNNPFNTWDTSCNNL